MLNMRKFRKDWQDKLNTWKKRREEIIEKYNKGASLNELAREFNVSPTRINNIVQKNDI